MAGRHTERDDGDTQQLDIERLEVDALFLANSVEVKDGLLYVLGGGWMRCWPPDGKTYPFERPLPAVVVFRVPYHDANIEHHFVVSMLDDDGQELLAKVEGGFKVGRDVNLTQGMSQLVPLGFMAPVKISHPGIYHIKVEVDGTEKKKIAFEALAAAPR